MRITKLGTLCYLEAEGKVLMLYRNKKENDMHEGKWIGLGGKLEMGESPEECIIREFKEESGLDIPHPIFMGTITFPLFDGGNDWHVFIYRAEAYEGELIESDEGSLKWIDINDLLTLESWEGDRVFLKWIFEDKKKFMAKMAYEGNRLSVCDVTFI